MTNKRGFTLLEILLVVAAIGILAGIVIVAINPGKQLAKTRNATRRSDVKTISNALYQYAIDHGSRFPDGVDTTLRVIGSSGNGCGVNCGNMGSAPASSPFSKSDDSQNRFADATFNNTKYSSSNGWVDLKSGTSGDLTSEIKDSGGTAPTWTTLAWIPQFPDYKELPNSGGKETGYPSGNADMTGNILLMHFNEAAGATGFTDSSGSQSIATCGGGVCPTMGGAGKLNTAGYFDGLNDYIQVKDTPALKFSGGEITISVWIKPDATATSGGTIISKPWNGNGGYNYWIQYANNNLAFCVGPERTVCIDTAVVPGVWTHLAATIDSSTMKIFSNGVEKGSREHGVTNWAPSSGDNNIPLSIGTFYPYGFSWSGASNHAFDGNIDELAMFNRVLSSTEILDFFKRGAARIKFQMRSCADVTCAGSEFSGPNGTSESYFTELTNAGLTPPNVSIASLSSNRYIQYKAFFETDRSAYSPALTSVTISGSVVPDSSSGTSGIGQTADACLDMSSSLVSDYLSAIPSDPSSGNASKTLYAVQKTQDGRLTVSACAAEMGETIQATK